MARKLTAFHGASLKKDKYAQEGHATHQALEQNGWKVHHIAYNGAEYRNKQYPKHFIETNVKTSFLSNPGTFNHYGPHKGSRTFELKGNGNHQNAHEYLSNPKNFQI